MARTLAHTHTDQACCNFKILINWEFSFRRVAHLHKFVKSMLYYMIFTPNATIRRFVNVCVSIRGQIDIHIEENQTPSHTMVFKMVTNDSDVKPPFIFPHCLTFNTEGYIKCLKTVQARIKRVAAWKPYIWQQNFAPCHKSRRTQSWPSENFCDHLAS